MDILVDTNVLVWAALGEPRLSPRASGLLNNAENRILVSAVSAWEVAIKASRGKLELTAEPDALFRDILSSARVASLPVSVEHAVQTFRLPQLHRDPFDRLLIAQAMVEGVPLLTADRMIRRYPVETIW